MKSALANIHPLIRTFLYSIWLPIAVIVLTIIRLIVSDFGSGEPVFESVSFMAKQIGLLFALAWPSAFPLTLALQKIYRRTRVTAIVVGAVLFVIAGPGVILGGLMGPIGVVVYAVAISLPAWLALGVVVVIQKNLAARHSKD